PESAAELTGAERDRIARVIGIGALKYADLSNDRVKDYVFDWDRMLALDGNTAPYLIYSYVRVQSIFRRARAQGFWPDDAAPAAQVAIPGRAPAERALVLHLLQFGEVVGAVAETLEPHRWCQYLFELATRFHRFFEHCPVLRADTPAQREGRLALC